MTGSFFEGVTCEILSTHAVVLVADKAHECDQFRQTPDLVTETDGMRHNFEALLVWDNFVRVLHIVPASFNVRQENFLAMNGLVVVLKKKISNSLVKVYMRSFIEINSPTCLSGYWKLMGIIVVKFRSHQVSGKIRFAINKDIYRRVERHEPGTAEALKATSVVRLRSSLRFRIMCPWPIITNMSAVLLGI